MLTRQWQLGEFQADDAGSPVSSQMLLERTELTELGAREAARDGVRRARSRSRPASSDVRCRSGWAACRSPSTCASRWGDGGRSGSPRPSRPATSPPTTRRHFRDGVPVPVTGPRQRPPTPGSRPIPTCGRRSPPWPASARSTAARCTSASRRRRRAPRTTAFAGIAVGDHAVLDTLGARLVDWFRDLVVPAAEPEVDAWDPQRLEYRFRAAGPERGRLGAALRRPRVPRRAAGLVAPRPATPRTRPRSTSLRPASWSRRCRRRVPSPVSFEGMPATRWWAFEDGRTNLGAVDAATTDIATMLFVEFALVYANDWFLTQLPMPVGSIAKVRGLAVTNVFGERFWIPPAGAGDDDTWQRWSMFSSSLVGAGEADTSLLVLPVAAKVQEGPPFEEVALVRDEMANMVWGLERTIPSGCRRRHAGRPVGRADGRRTSIASATPCRRSTRASPGSPTCGTR